MRLTPYQESKHRPYNGWQAELSVGNGLGYLAALTNIAFFSVDFNTRYTQILKTAVGFPQKTFRFLNRADIYGE
jgi:hypothetical protein